MNNKETLIKVENLKKYFPMNKSNILTHTQNVKAVDGISFDILKGETFGLVGESGSGKSTTGHLILRLLNPTDGKVYVEDKDIYQHSDRKFRKMRKDLQIIFQDASWALDPKMIIEDILTEPLRIHKIVPRFETEKEVKRLLDIVGLSKNDAKKFPHEFSGGQRQRIGIAKAISTRPKFILCDEPVSALDVSIQSKILNLLTDLQREYDLTYLFIAHGLNVVKHVSDRVGVMYLGKIMEIGNVNTIYNDPKHPYTKALISAFPDPNPEVKNERIVLKGEIPSPINPPKGCLFHTRCPYKMDICDKVIPQLTDINEGHKSACFLNEEVMAKIE
ncbi:ABC transporter ATP-binding protein [Clostridium sp. D2Q-11]|uniref:ABC transporter ATP-binding protein n=1 Tax=Anaeromonas frigoriresistens TaxID=2683708 RepID=A0A942Z9Q9_9FIRM|nr:ABC transporter ATP-binding protein [Anaeromonas frigoriresistens]MBS4539090.1 ABC transporter ATP-binding protein [Anaeromonas frigoriresistens]